MPGIPITSKAIEASVAAQKASIPTGKQLISGGAKFGGTISAPAAIGAGVILGISEGLFPRRTVTEADEQRAIRQAEATRQWRKEQKDKANKNPNLDHLPSSQIISQDVIEAGFTGGQESGVRYAVRFDYGHISFGQEWWSTNYGIVENLIGSVRAMWMVRRSSDNSVYDIISFNEGEAVSPPVNRFSGSYIFELHVSDANGDDRIARSFAFEEMGKFYDLHRMDGQPDNSEAPPPIVENEIISEISPIFLSVQPTDNNNLTEITAATPKQLAKQLYGLIKAGRIDDAQTTPEVRDELKKLIAANNAITDKTNVVDSLNNNDGYATAYSDGYQDGFTASLERDRLNAQNKANNLDVAILKPSNQVKEKQKPVATTIGHDAVTQEKVKESTTTTKTYVAGSTPIKETTITNPNTGVKTVTKAHAETGKVVSIKRTVPAGVTVTKAGVDNTPITNTPTTSYKFVGTPANTGIGVTSIPQVPTIEQAPTIPQIAGGAITTAAIAAAVYSESGIETLTSAAAAGTCQTTQPGGCMQKNVVDPINASTGTLFNNFANTALAAQNAAIQAIVQNTNDIVKHGTYGLQAIQEAAGKAWEATHMDKVINIANLLVATHNAAMLSRNLGETIAEFGTSALQVFGIKHPVTGEAIDVGEVVGSTIQTAINSIVPEAIRTNVSATWIKLNRIHSAAVAMASAVTATKNAVLEANEVIGDWVARIGNAQQEQGIVEEDSYPWMKDNNNFTDPYQGFLGKLNNAEEVISQASSFVNAAIELKDSVEQVTTSKEELTNALNEFNTTKAAEETTKETESASPDVDRLDLIQLEPDEIES